MIPDVLADRYTSPAMTAIWSPEGKVRLERRLWIAVMRAQRELGLDIPEQAIDAYERVEDQVDLESIRERERVTRHDVKARIDEFCALAGYEHVHKGLTSRDLTENVEQLQVRTGLELVRLKYAAALGALAERTHEQRALALTARTHNVPAQLTTMGKRLAMFGQDMLLAFAHLESILDRYALRGLKGAVGTQLDLLTLLGGDRDRVVRLEERIRNHLGFRAVLGAVGQVYPRSLDFEVVCGLHQLAAGPSSLAKTLRLMAGHELASEGFQAGQVGSSAMPHKMNSRSCERLNGLNTVLGGFLHMAAALSGDQWNEGDVSCSVVRRVALPGAMFAIDGLLETFLTIVREMQISDPAVTAERERYLPFLSTTTVLMEAVRHGAGRESAHEAIKEHAVAVARDLREGRSQRNDLLARLAADRRLPLDEAQLAAVLQDRERFLGMAPLQVDAFLVEVEGILERIPEARGYQPEKIL